jgi:hypothetical protein
MCLLDPLKLASLLMKPPTNPMANKGAKI